jgi:hypothetical protein
MVAEPRLGACDAAVIHAVHGLKAYARHADIVWVVGHSGRRGCKATASRGRSGGTCGLVFGGCGSAVLADTMGFLGGALACGRSPWAMAYAIGPISGCHRHQGYSHITHATQPGREARNQTRWAIRHTIGPAHQRRPWCTRAGRGKTPSPGA